MPDSIGLGATAKELRHIVGAVIHHRAMNLEIAPLHEIASPDDLLQSIQQAAAGLTLAQLLNRHAACAPALRTTGDFIRAELQDKRMTTQGCLAWTGRNAALHRTGWVPCRWRFIRLKVWVLNLVAGVVSPLV
ncbi:hypothetical protein [Polaromonas sp. CG_9.5]|uniref:hypothetical protein n=1 Tax=Polaromonas sp. CG_9.5 TaxID=3071705 RepID=UPI002E0F1311